MAFNVALAMLGKSQLRQCAHIAPPRWIGYSLKFLDTAVTQTVPASLPRRPSAVWSTAEGLPFHALLRILICGGWRSRPRH